MSTPVHVDQVLFRAEEAFHRYKRTSAADKAKFLRMIAADLEKLSDDFITVVMQETHLPEARLKNEKNRTIHQLRSFAQLVETGDWVQASIDTADRERKPLAKPDIRKMYFPLGPVVVFGASNFPLAFSTAGGDTASALAAGCSVIVKSHPAHPQTSKYVAQVIDQAIEACGMPKYIFQHVEDTSIEVGQQLVKHAATQAVAFTGSYQGGKALFDLACKRKRPIPVFAEMGSVNPVVVLPSAMKDNNLPGMLASSILLGAGQFCTNPGLLLVAQNDLLDEFLQRLTEKMNAAPSENMLHTGIAQNYHHRKKLTLSQAGVTLLTSRKEDQSDTATPALAVVDVKDFIANGVMKEEVFGPFSLAVKCVDEIEMLSVAASLDGQLTASIFGSPEECAALAGVIDVLQERSGRVIYGGVPTGVEVCKSMHHGGPFPATTDSRFTSVGTDAIYRFVRPLSFQDFPQEMLPDELKDQNPRKILRCINQVWTRDAVRVLNFQPA